MKNISIVGTGLIGCSIAMGVKGMFKCIAGFDINQQNIDYAINAGIIDESWTIERIAYESDVIIVAIPVDAAIPIVYDLLSKIKVDAVIIDVGSTKLSICRAVQNHPNRKNFVAAHPMAGSEIGGPQGSGGNLFKGKKSIICQAELSSKLAIQCAEEIFRVLGMEVEYIDEERHDSLVSLVSHLPQIVSYGIASTVGCSIDVNHQWFDIAASGFDSTTRLAKSPLEVWIPILIQNKEYISQNLQLFIHQIEIMKELIESENIEALNQFICQSQAVREKFDNNIKNKKNGNKTINRFGTTEAVVARVE
ncbi:MAG: prephenate dehydrogenase/arogenate dehydrogenase family protein [Bacteroidales bacterium]|nr:prephenate dehydrogenase/arogenate dehydrogenase family protein [Bacteroidales bacterium]